MLARDRAAKHLKIRQLQSSASIRMHMFTFPLARATSLMPLRVPDVTSNRQHPARHRPIAAQQSPTTEKVLDPSFLTDEFFHDDHH